MTIQGDHGNFNFSINTSGQSKRIEIKSGDQILHSIAVKTFPNKALSYRPGWVNSILRNLLTAFSWKWIKGDDNTIINVNSLAKHTGLTKDAIRTAAKAGNLIETITGKLTETAQIEKHNTIEQLKEFPVKTLKAIEVLKRAASLQSGQIQTVNIFWNPVNKSMLVSGPANPKPYMNRSEIEDTYQVKAQVYKEDNTIYLLLDNSKMNYIDKREFRDGTLDVYLHPTPKTEKQEQILADIRKNIFG